MNLLSIFLISFLSAALIAYIFLTRRTFKKLSQTLIAFQIAGQKLESEYNSLVEKYLQLAKINEVLRDLTKSRKK